MKNNIQTAQLWDKIKIFAQKAGRIASRPVILLYYVLTSDTTPRSDKLLIGGALAYLVLPINLVSVKKHPLVGWMDEAASIKVAYDKVSKHITPEMERKADEALNRWFTEPAIEVK